MVQQKQGIDPKMEAILKKMDSIENKFGTLNTYLSVSTIYRGLGASLEQDNFESAIKLKEQINQT